MRAIPLLLLLAACGRAEQPLLRPGAPAEGPAEGRSRFAGLDDVRLLANGLLQLGQSLREFVQKTKGQISDIFQKLNIFDRSFYQLAALATEIRQEEEELKKTTLVLQASSQENRGLSAAISSKVDGMLRDKGRLQDQLDGLEERLSGLVTGDPAEINGLRDVIQAQERSITELLAAVREQSEQLNHQRVKIRSLEEKLTANILTQETIEKIPEVYSEAPKLTPYLTSGSAPSDRVMNLPSDCSELFNRGERVSGVFAIRPDGREPFMAFCDMSRGLGATVFQRRQDGSVNFDQTWENYENGFGDFQGEFWLGLRKIHVLASRRNAVLHVELEDWKQGRRSHEYRFHLGGPEGNYTAHLTRLSGELPDPMSNHTGMMFSTRGRDDNKHPESSCAHTGGWWFNACGDASLNGRYLHFRAKGRPERRRGIQWRPGQRASFSQISIYPAAPSSTISSTTAPPEAGGL